MAKQPFIIVPLYIYPLEEAWEPLFEAARAHPKLQFLVVVNPSSGPGSTKFPDAGYVAVLHRLAQVPNIRPLGYTHCSYGKRSLDAISKDIDVYRGWNDKFRLEGIFFDETPSDPDYVHFMATVAEYTKATWKKNLDQDGVVVYNPGVVVERSYFDHPDYVVVFEQSQEHWNRYFVDYALSQLAPDVRSKVVAIVHSCEPCEKQVTGLAKEIGSLGIPGLFLTDQLGGGYTKWPAAWTRISEVLAVD